MTGDMPKAISEAIRGRRAGDSLSENWNIRVSEANGWTIFLKKFMKTKR